MTAQEILDQLNAEGNEGLARLSMQAIVDSAKKRRPFILVTDDVFPEIPVALTISVAIMTVAGAYGTAGAEGPGNIDRATELGIETRLCASVKVAAWLVLSGQIPKPDAIITTNSPCDAVQSLGQLLDNYKPWADVPRFYLDAPHGNDQDSFRYLGKQLQACVAFLEGIAGRKLDRQRLLEVCKESNKQMQLLLELQELKRAVPCPFDPDLPRKGWQLGRWVAPIIPEIYPRVTGWIEQALAAAEGQAKLGLGMPGVTEKIRYLWYDVSPIWAGKLFPRLRQELGAVDIMTYYSYMVDEMIDTTDEESIFESIARKYLMATPMTRQAMHTPDVYCQDVVRICRDFKCDAMIMPSHVGHRDTNSYYHVVKDVCRENGIPFMFIGCDVWDERYMSPDVVFDRMKTFFQVMGLTK